jgi:hypothetical protein
VRAAGWGRLGRGHRGPRSRRGPRAAGRGGAARALRGAAARPAAGPRAQAAARRPRRPRVPPQPRRAFGPGGRAFRPGPALASPPPHPPRTPPNPPPLQPASTTFIVPGECFPTKFRSTCHGISAAWGKAGAILGVYGFGAINDQHGTQICLGLLSIFMFLGERGGGSCGVWWVGGGALGVWVKEQQHGSQAAPSKCVP